MNKLDLVGVVISALITAFFLGIAVGTVVIQHQLTGAW